MRRSCWAAFTERARDVGAEGRSAACVYVIGHRGQGD